MSTADEARLERAKAAFRGADAWKRSMHRPADDESPWQGPYCMAPYCHNSRTAYYYTGMEGTGTAQALVLHPVTYIGLRPFAWAERLCRSHALLRHKVALG